jgi:putative transposase
VFVTVARGRETPRKPSRILRFDGRVARIPRTANTARIQHVTTRGNGRRDVLVDDHDRAALLTQLAEVSDGRAWSILACCLMSNHLHVIIEAPIQAISTGMRDALGPYARRFHRRHGGSGHLFGDRFHAVGVTADSQFAATITYVHMNPVRVGLVPKPGHWAWSSYRAATGTTQGHALLDTLRLWELTGRDPDLAQQHLRALSMAPLP